MNSRSSTMSLMTARLLRPRILRTLSSSKSSFSGILAKASSEKTDRSSAESSMLPSQNPDSFGTLSLDNLFVHEQDRERDLEDHDEEEEFQKKIADTLRPRPSDFLRSINSLVRSGDLGSAIRVLDDEMKSEFVKPREKHFRVLIWACGRQGYAKKAFELYGEYCRRDIRPNQGVHADLFNACANCPFPDFALEKAIFLRKKLVQQSGRVWPQELYHCMIKAFGRCGDLQTAFSIVDEMAEKKVPVDAVTVAHLLQGCISDKHAGFRHAVLAWRSLLCIGAEPGAGSFRRRQGKLGLLLKHSIHLYHLLLRCAKECGAGEGDFHYDLMLACMSVEDARAHNVQLLEEGTKKDLSSSSDIRDLDEEVSAVAERSSELPNVLEDKPNFQNVLCLGDLSLPTSRLQLLGGVSGVCAALHRQNLAPDAKLFTYLLDLIGDDEVSENKLLSTMEAEKVVPDTIFFNMLIRRRGRRGERKLGLSTLSLMNSIGAEVDLVTFGVLATCCSNKRDSIRLLADMDARGTCPNAVVFTSLLSGASSRFDPDEVLCLLQSMDHHGINPDHRVLRELERFQQRFRKLLLLHERGHEIRNKRFKALVASSGGSGIDSWVKFRAFYSDWLSRTKLDKSDNLHVWRQFLTEKDKSRLDVDYDYRQIWEEGQS